MVISLNNSHTKLRRYIRIGYSTIETKEVARIGYNGFLFPHEYSGEGQKPVISNTGNFFCFNSTVSNLYNNDATKQMI